MEQVLIASKSIFIVVSAAISTLSINVLYSYFSYISNKDPYKGFCY